MCARHRGMLWCTWLEPFHPSRQVRESISDFKSVKLARVNREVAAAADPSTCRPGLALQTYITNRSEHENCPHGFPARSVADRVEHDMNKTSISAECARRHGWHRGLGGVRQNGE